MDLTINPDIIPTREAARIIGVSIQRIQQLIRSEELDSTVDHHGGYLLSREQCLSFKRKRPGRKENHKILDRKALKVLSLDAQEEKIVNLRLDKGMTFGEIAKELNIPSRQRVYQIYQKIINSVRNQ